MLGLGLGARRGWRVFKGAANWILRGGGKVGGVGYRYFLRWPILGGYKLWLGGKKIWQEGQQDETGSPWNNILFGRANVHLLLVLLSGLVIAGNLTAKNSAQASASQGALFFSILGNESEDITEDSGFDLSKIESSDLDAVSENDWNSLPEEVLDELGSSGLAMEGSALLQPQLTPSGAAQRTKIETYPVEDGDTLAGIAEKFGISVNTILWENSLSISSKIKPGQKIVILPVSGLTYKVKSGDNLQKIANLYKGNIESIMDVNGLSSANAIRIGQNLIIPGGVQPRVISTPVVAPIAGAGRDDYYVTHDSSLAAQKAQARPVSPYGGHKFPWGQCTWYVAQKRYVPWSGNANQWINNARAFGYAIGNTPKVGAIMVTRESWWGHVVYVESFNNKTVTFSEANYKGLGVITRRTLNLNDRRIIGYIY